MSTHGQLYLLAPWWWALGLDAHVTPWAPEVSLPGSLDTAADTGHVEPEVTSITLNPGHSFFLGQAATRGCTGLPAPSHRRSHGGAHGVLRRMPKLISEEKQKPGSFRTYRKSLELFLG